MGIEALLTSQVIGLDAALTGKLDTSGGTLTGALNGTSANFSGEIKSDYIPGSYRIGRFSGPSGTYIQLDEYGQFYFNNGTKNKFGMDASSLHVPYDGALGFSSGNVLGSIDTVLYRDTAGTLAQRRSTYAQTFRLYNTYTSSTSFENLQLQWASNEARIGTSVGSAGGTQRSLVLGTWNSAGAWAGTVTIGSSGSVKVIRTAVASGYNAFNETLRAENLDNASLNIVSAVDRSSHIYFSDTAYAGHIQYYHVDDSFNFFNAGQKRIVFDSSGCIQQTPTWNSLATTFTGILANVTDTQSASGSLLMDLQVGGTSQFSVRKDGNISIANLAGLRPAGSSAGVYVYNNANTPVFFRDTSANQKAWLTNLGFMVASDYAFGWSSNGTSWSAPTPALSLYRDAADTLAQRNSTNAQTFRLYNTYTSATSFENLQLQWSSNEARIGTSVGSAGGTLRSLALGSWNSAGTWRSAITITGSSSTEDTTLPNVGVSKINSISGWVAINAIGGGSFYTGDTNSASPGVFFVGTLINPSDTALTHRFAVDPVNNVVHIGGYRRAAAADGLLSASYAKGTDIAGSSLCIAGGRGTGTGAGGSVRIQTAPAGSTGTSLNALVDRLTIDSTGAATFSGQLTNALGTITASTPATFTQTWNNVATTFTSLLANVTDTASASGSLLLDLQVGGTSQVKATKQGYVTARSFATTQGSDLDYNRSGLQLAGFGVNAGIWFGSGASVGIISETDANTLGIRNSTSAQVFRIYNTYTSSTSYERGKIAWESNVLKIGTEKGSAGGSARALELQTDGTQRVLIEATGLIRFNNYSGVNLVGDVFWTEINGRFSWGTSGSRSSISSSADGVIHVSNAARNDFSRLQFGGTTSSFPAIKRNSAAINFRLADDSADCDITAKAATFSGNVTVSQGTSDASVLTSTGYSLTGANAQSLIDVAGTWNTTGTPTLIKANVTDTASNASSLLLDLQVGGTSQLKVAKNGRLTVCPSNGVIFGGGGTRFTLGIGTTGYFVVGTSSTGVASTYAYGWSSTSDSAGDPDLRLYRDAARTLALRDGVNANVLNIYNTYTSSTSYERGKVAWESNVLRIGTEKGSAGGSARALELQTDGVTRVTFATGNLTTFSGKGVFTGAADCLTLVRTGLCSFALGDADGDSFRIMNAGDSSDMLRIHGTTKLVTFYGNLSVGTRDIVTDTTTGTKIGTGTTQKIGFWNATPIVQPTTGVASATSGLGMGNAITDDQTFDGYTVAQIVKALRNIGLLA